MALEAIVELLRIVEIQFGSGGHQPWFIADTPGEVYIAKEAEPLPFIRRVYLPNSHLVGPMHTLDVVHGRFVVRDEHLYEDRDVTDAEFSELRRRATGSA
ncbi:MAG: hypothetical protein LC804_10050 [Acidobacteria bacterium]|nr:hypothetical protein [Acidobacteriota bacterium]